MRLKLKIVFFLSLIINGFFLFDEIRFYRVQEFGKALNAPMSEKLGKTDWQQGLKIFTSKLNITNKSLLNKKYYYINVWTSWCEPCLKEMPWLDSIAGTLNKDVGYFFVSEMSDEEAIKSLKVKNYNIKNFIFLNEMKDFVSAICYQKGTKNNVYPMVLILSNKGELILSSNGGYGNRREAGDFANMINKLD